MTPQTDIEEREIEEEQWRLDCYYEAQDKLAEYEEDEL